MQDRGRTNIIKQSNMQRTGVLKPKALSSTELHSNAARWNESLQPKNFSFKVRKKKQLSVLKKKIAMERLRKELIRAGRNKVSEDSDLIDYQYNYFITIRNFITFEELLDEDERNEVFHNITALLNDFAQIDKIRIFKVLYWKGDEQIFVEVAFCQPVTQLSALQAINGMILGGNPIEISPGGMKDMNWKKMANYVSSVEDELDEPINVELPPDYHIVKIVDDCFESRSNAWLYLENLVGLDELEDEDEICEIIDDIVSLCKSFRSLQAVLIKHFPCVVTKSISPTNQSRSEAVESPVLIPGDSPIALIEFSHIEDAMFALEKLTGLIVGGSEVKAKLLDYNGFLVDRHVCIDFTPSSPKAKFGIRCRGFTTWKDMTNEPKRQEILYNLSLIIQECWGIDDIMDEDSAVPLSFFTCESSNRQTDKSEFADVIVFLPSVELCVQLFSFFRTRLFDGAVIEVDIIQLIERGKSKILHLICSKDGSAAISLEGFYSQQDLDDVKDSPEDMASLKKDWFTLLRDNKDGYQVQGFISRFLLISNEKLDKIAEKRSKLNDSYSNRIMNLHDLKSNSLKSFNHDESVISDNKMVGKTASMVSNEVSVAVIFNSEYDAEDALVYLHGYNVSGVELKVKVNKTNDAESADFLQKGLSFYDQARDQWCIQYVQPTNPNEIRILGAESTGGIVAGRCYVTPRYRVKSEEHKLIGQAINHDENETGGSAIGNIVQSIECLYEYHLDMNDTSKAVTLRSSSKSPKNNYRIAEKNGDLAFFQDETGEDKSKRISKYEVAKSAPNLPKHSAPIDSPYDIPVADENINSILKELLKQLATFQQRMKERNPEKAHQKPRFVCGIKQSTNAVKGERVKLLLIAINTEESEALDEKLAKLLSAAKEKGVPTLYCLSKRLLGKSLQMSIKQSVVAIFDPDGAYELYKAVMKFISPDF